MNDLVQLLQQAQRAPHPPAPELAKPPRPAATERSRMRSRAVSDLSAAQRRELAAALQSSLLKGETQSKSASRGDSEPSRIGRRTKMAGLAALMASTAFGTGVIFSTAVGNLPPPRPPTVIRQAEPAAPPPAAVAQQKIVAEAEPPLQASASGVLAPRESAFSGPFSPQFRVRNGEGNFSSEQSLPRTAAPSVSTLTAADRGDTDQGTVRRAAPAQPAISPAGSIASGSAPAPRTDGEGLARPAAPGRPVAPTAGAAATEVKRTAARTATPPKQRPPAARPNGSGEPLVLQPPPARVAAVTRTNLQQNTRTEVPLFEQLFGKVEGARDDQRGDLEKANR